MNQASIDSAMFEAVVSAVFDILYRGKGATGCGVISMQRGVGPILENFILENMDAWRLSFETRTIRLPADLYVVEILITTRN